MVRLATPNPEEKTEIRLDQLVYFLSDNLQRLETTQGWPPNLMQVLRHRLSGKRFREIAALMNKSIGTIGDHMRQIHKRLRIPSGKNRHIATREDITLIANRILQATDLDAAPLSIVFPPIPVRRPPKPKTPSPYLRPPSTRPEPIPIAPDEMELLCSLVELGQNRFLLQQRLLGRSTTSIGDELGQNDETVNHRLGTIYQTLGFKKPHCRGPHRPIVEQQALVKHLRARCRI